MTFKEDFYNKHPNAPVSADGTPRFCPWLVGYAHKGDCNFDCPKCWDREMPDMKIDRTDEYERQAEEFGKVCVAVGKKIHHIDPINKMQIALAIYLKVNSK